MPVLTQDHHRGAGHGGLVVHPSMHMCMEPLLDPLEDILSTDAGVQAAGGGLRGSRLVLSRLASNS